MPHHHYYYVLGLQPKRVINAAEYSIASCPVSQVLADMTFQRINGSKEFCIYIRVFQKTTAASSAHSFSRRMAKSTDIFPIGDDNFVADDPLVALSSPRAVRHDTLQQLARGFTSCIDLIDHNVEETKSYPSADSCVTEVPTA